MLRRTPKLTYSGLTVVLSNPSRFDHTSLLTATGGRLFNDYCLRPEFNLMQCDVRLAEDKSELLSGTKCIALLGEYAMRLWLPETRNNILNEMRGSLFYYKGIPAIPSFYPQDAADVRTYEQELNTLSKEFTGGDETTDESDDEGDVKRYGHTARRNYAFWLRLDINKCKTILTSGVPSSPYPAPRYHIYPNSTEVLNVLTQTKNQFLWFDMETDIEEANMQCFSFSFDGCNIYSVPVLDNNYKPAYSCIPHILRALAIGISNNTFVAYNGATFDFFVLGYKYRIPVGHRLYDPMLAHHRCWPDVEKSLGHSVSHLTWERFHKDEDSQGYRTPEHMIQRLKYCAKDVYTMFLVHKGIELYAKTIPGLQDSIDTVMRCIRPYLITSLQGIKYDPKQVTDLMSENDRLMTQYIRIVNILIGEEGMRDIKSRMRGKTKALPGSNTQCCTYFHDILGYPVVARSQKTGKPSLGKKAMYKLRLKHENPVIDLILAYRKIAKEYGTLKFIPWLLDDNKTHGETNTIEMQQQQLIMPPV